MAYWTVSLTSQSTTTSAPVNLNWIGGKPTTVSVIATSLSTGAFTIQYTLDDLQRTTAASVAWQVAAASFGATFPSTATAGTVFVASNAYPDGVTYTFLGPIAGLRLGSSTPTQLTMRVLQGEGG